jgi:hypothetical protein
MRARSSLAAGLGGGDLLLKMSKSGVWNYGVDEVEVEDGSEWAINPATLRHGYICWRDTDSDDDVPAGVVGEQMVSIQQEPPAVGEVPAGGRSWEAQFSVLLQCVSGDDKGTSVLYKTNSNGGRQAFAALIDALGAQLDDDPEHIVPVVQLETSQYKHRKYGKTYKPELEIVRWVSFESSDAEEEEPEPPQAPVEEEPTLPKRRRRRTA